MGMQAVVGDFAAELEQHYQDPSNTLELSLKGSALRFAPLPVSTTTTTTTTSTTTTTTTTTTTPTTGGSASQNDVAVSGENGLNIGVLAAVIAAIAIVILVVVLVVVVIMRNKAKTKHEETVMDVHISADVTVTVSTPMNETRKVVKVDVEPEDVTVRVMSETGKTMDADVVPEDAVMATAPLPETRKIVEAATNAAGGPEDETAVTAMPTTTPETQKIVETSYPVSEIRKIVDGDDGDDKPEEANAYYTPLPETETTVEAAAPISEIRKIVDAGDDDQDKPKEAAGKDNSEFMEHDDTKHDDSQKVSE